MTQVTKSTLFMSNKDWWYSEPKVDYYSDEVTTSGVFMTSAEPKCKSEASQLIAMECDAIKELLLMKNAAYGDSALNPANIFASGSAVDNLACRIDDKLMRIKNRGLNDETEDTVSDLIGYLILLKIAMR